MENSEGEQLSETIEEDTGDLIDLNTLGQFFEVLDPTLATNDSKELSNSLFHPEFLTTVIQCLGRNVIGISELDQAVLPPLLQVDKILHNLATDLGGEYEITLKEIQSQIQGVTSCDDIPTHYRQLLGEVLVALSIMSPNASEIVDRIITQLSQKAQIEIQLAIQKFSIPDAQQSPIPSLSSHQGMSETPEKNKSINKSASYSDVIDSCGSSSNRSNNSSSNSSSHAPPMSPVTRSQLLNNLNPKKNYSDTVAAKHPFVPKLAISGVIQPKEQSKNVRASKWRNPSSIHDEDAESLDFSYPIHTERLSGLSSRNIWTEKYESLKLAVREGEAMHQQLLSEHEKLKEEFKEQSDKYSRLKQQIELQSSQTHRAATNTIDVLERELAQTKQLLNDALREKRDCERNLQDTLTRLQDETQMLTAEAEKTERLELTVSKYKTKIEELQEYKTKNAQLEAHVQECLHQLIEAEEANKLSLDIKKSRDYFKSQVLSLETELNDVKKHNSQLQSELNDLNSRLEQARKSHQTEVQGLRAKHDATLYAAQTPLSGLAEMSLQEKLEKLERENAVLREYNQKQADEKNLKPLTKENEDLKKTLETTTCKLTELQKLIESDDKTSFSRIAILEKEKEIAVRDAQLETARVQNKALELQIKEEKDKSSLIEEAAKARVEEQFNVIVSTLKEQIQLRERELNFIRMARDEQIAIQRREERFMAAAFHELGFRCAQLKSEVQKTQQEYEGILLKMDQTKTSRTVS